MDVDYETLTHGEICRLASEGDTKARQMLDEVWAEFRSALESAPPNSLAGYLNEISKFRDKDMEAGMRLSKSWYSKGRIFAPQRWEVLRDYVNLKRDDDKGRDVWWNIEIVIPALISIVYSPEVLDLPITEVYRFTRNKVRAVIEKDLTGGYTSDEKEFENIPLADITEMEGAALEESMRAVVDELIDLKNALDELSPEKYQILLASSYGDLKNFAQELGKTAGAIRTIKTRAKKELKDKLNSM